MSVSVTRRHSLALVLGAAVLSAAACSDSTAPSGVLTAEETSELARQMGVHIGNSFSSSAASTAAASAGAVSLDAAPSPISVSFTATVPCPRGGTTRLTATMNGTIDNATDSVVADVTGAQRLEDCGYDVHAKTIWVTGELTATAHAETKNDQPVGTHTASLKGQFSWRASDGRRGSCSVNYSATANYTKNVATVTGNFCGSTIEVTAPITS